MIERTYNTKLITKIITHPDIYDYVADDGSPPSEDYAPMLSDSIYYLVCDAGMFIYAPINAITWEVHSCVLPSWRGKSIQFAKASIDWMFDNTECLKIITHVPSYNKRALVYAERAGMVTEGVNRMSFAKNGEIYDQTLLGVICQ